VRIVGGIPERPREQLRRVRAVDDGRLDVAGAERGEARHAGEGRKKAAALHGAAS